MTLTQNLILPRGISGSRYIGVAADAASRVLELKQPMPLAMFADSRLLTADDLQALEQQLQQLEQGGDSC